jgi:hypothetical protein
MFRLKGSNWRVENGPNIRKRTAEPCDHGFAKDFATNGFLREIRGQSFANENPEVEISRWAIGSLSNRQKGKRLLTRRFRGILK